MRAYLNSGSRNGLGTRPQDDPEEMAFQIRRWTYFVWLGGDMPVEAHVHFLDICNWVMAKDGDPKKAHPIEANGMGGCTWPSNYGELFDQHFVEYTYADGTKLFSQCRRRSGCWISRGVYAHGTKGWSMCRTDGRRQSERPHYQEQIDLVQAIRNNERRNEGWYGATSSMTGVLGRMATYSGQLVRWDDAVAKGPDEGPKRLAFDALPPHLPGPDGRYPIAAPGVYKPY
jgi:hypothetical protein